MSLKIKRREAVAGLSASALLPLVGCSSVQKPDGGDERRFAHGVASGDPAHDSVVLWTRVSVSDDEARGEWELAEDDGFSVVVRRGSFITHRERDLTVKVVADGLRPGTRYFYRFISGGQTSPVGRTLTLPVGELAQLGLALASCSNYPFGYFNAYESIALDPEVDVVVHLGDYIYEYGPDGYGGKRGAELDREHQPPSEIYSLQDYRTRHAQYKSDAQSQKMHAAHPLIAIWDDHESTNNPWMHGAENHQDDEGDWHARRAASLQAYYEWMPVRDPQLPAQRKQYWRHFQFGNLASLVTLETRHTGRSEQVEYGDHPEALESADNARAFMQQVVGAPNRNMLAPEMEAFLDGALRESVAAGRPWRMIGNQIPMARTQTPRIDEEVLAALDLPASEPLPDSFTAFRKRGDLGLPLYLDPWDGYPWAREKFYRLCRQAQVSDLLVLTGDSHSFWQNQLFADDGTAMGVEIGTTGVTSPGDFVDFGPKAAEALDRSLVRSNREILWTEGRTHGYVRIVLRPEWASVTYIGVSSIDSTQYKPKALRQLRLRPDGEGSLRYSTVST